MRSLPPIIVTHQAVVFNKPINHTQENASRARTCATGGSSLRPSTDGSVHGQSKTAERKVETPSYVFIQNVRKRFVFRRERAYRPSAHHAAQAKGYDAGRYISIEKLIDDS